MSENSILIYPVTGNLSDITNTDVTTTHAININILSLENNKGIAIYQNGNLTYKDFNNDIANELIFNDVTNVDMTVTSYNIYNIYVDDSDIIKAYLYDSKRKRTSDIFTKNIIINYKVSINITGINLSDIKNPELDSTIVIDTTELTDKRLFIKHISGIYNKVYNVDSHTNIYEFETTDSTNLIYTLEQDSVNRLFNYNNLITAYAVDSDDNKVSKEIKKEYYIPHVNCETPLMIPTITDYGTYYTWYASPTNSSTYQGDLHSCCIFTKRMNITIQPYKYFQKNRTYFDIFNNYSTTSSKTITYGTPILITSYLSQGDSLDEDIRGELDTTETNITTDITLPKLYNNHSLINYTSDSIFLLFKLHQEMLPFDYYNVHTLRVRNNRTNDIARIQFPNNFSNQLVYFDDYTDTATFGEFNITGPDWYTTADLIELGKYNLQYNNLDSVNSQVITNSTWELKYTERQLYLYEDEIPVMMRVVTNHKVRLKVQMTGAEYYFPSRLTELVDVVINPNEPFELRQSEDFYVDPGDYYFVMLQFELLDTTTVDAATAQDIEFNTLISPILDNRLYIKKEDLSFQEGDELEWFTLQGEIYENPDYIYNISDISKMVVNTETKSNKPYIQYDKGSEDLSIEITEFSTDITSSVDLYFRTYLIDATVIPDFTTIVDLDIGDIVHVFGFALKKEYIVEAYIIPDNTNIVQSEIKQFSFKTATGVCSTPVVVRDNELGELVITCAGNCRPAYTYVTSNYTDGDTMHHITFQDGLNTAQGEPNEQLIVHPYSNRGCNIYLDSTEATVCMRPYAIRYDEEQPGVFFAFSCIGNDLTYASSEVIESENYPDQSMCPVGNLVYYDAGRSSLKLYEHNYARGNGSYNASRLYRKNDGSLIDTGTYYYALLTINIGETIEIKQEDTYSNYGHSWSIKKKRWA